MHIESKWRTNLKRKEFNVDETRSREKENAPSTKRKDILPHSFLRMHGRGWQDLGKLQKNENERK